MMFVIIRRVLLFIIRSIVSFSFLFDDFSFLCVCISFCKGGVSYFIVFRTNKGVSHTKKTIISLL